jgi:hypothetical protein
MVRFARLAVGLTALASVACVADAPAQDPHVLWDEARAFETFLEEADERRDTWLANRDRARVPDDLLARARAVGGAWRMLVVAEDWCGDSVHNVPYLARLADEVDGLELRVVDSKAGRGILDGHRTPDGREATPTLVLLDDAGSVAGCWVERPAELQAWWLDNAELAREARVDHVYAWYEEDRGRSAVRELVERLEAAAAGTPICEARPPGEAR